MAKGNFIQAKFTSGEWSPLLEGQVTLEKYANALYRLENFIIDPHGPVRFRPGWRYIASTKTSAKRSILIPFVFSVTQAYMLEFGDYYIRFYKDQEQIFSGAVPYEIVSPYAEADLAQLKYVQSADVLYLRHPTVWPRKLSRTGHTSWTIAEVNYRPGPMKEQGIEPVATLTLAATTGANILFTAGASVFQTGDVGRMITSGVGRASIISFTSATQVRCDIIDDFSAVGPIASQSWSLLGSPSGSITPSAKEPVGAMITLTGSSAAETITNFINPGSDYWSLSGSGTNEYYGTAAFIYAAKPDKLYIDDVEAVEGVVGTLGINQWCWDDNDAIGHDTVYVRLASGDDPDSVLPATYVKSGVITATTDLFRATDVGKYVRVHGGLVKITAYTSASSVTGQIMKELSAVTATSTWTLESEVWGSANGYPSCATFYEDRLCEAGCPTYPETVWGSVVGDYENHTPGVDDADAFEFTISGREVNVIRWLEPDEYLLVGSVGMISRVGPDDVGSSLTPLNVVAKRQSPDGAANILPVATKSGILYVSRTGFDDSKGLKVQEIAWSWQSDKYVTPDMTILAEHITGDGLDGICYQKEPFSMLWGWTTAGTPVSMTYLREEDVIGWASHPTDGEIESMATIPGDGYDEVWAVICRTVGGAFVRYVEMAEKIFNDDAATYTANKGLNAFFVDSGITYNGAAATVIPGLDHLVGESVVALADGSFVSAKTVSAAGTITLSKAASVVHVGLPYTGYVQTMRLDATLASGTVQGKVKKIDDLVIRVNNSATFKCGPDATNLVECFDRERTIIFGGGYTLFTGDIPVGFDDGFNRDARVMIVQDKPMPLTVVALMMSASL